MKTVKSYPESYKRDVLEMLGKGDRSAAQLERDLGLSEGIVLKWKKRYSVQGNQLAPSEERAQAGEMQRLKRELEIVKQERDILKKALQVFSREER
jgi:transposase